jgi:hypothetical protein
LVWPVSLRGLSALGVVLALAPLGCASSADAPAKGEQALSTGSRCPSSSTLTYEGWAQGFFASYCTRCHSSTLVTASERHGATPHANWDDLDTIRVYKVEIDEYAAGGPDVVNRVMPPSDPVPPDEERIKLGEWLACDLP